MGREKNNLFLYQILFCFVLAVASSIVQSQSDYKTFTDEKNGYSIEYVADWQVIKSKFADGGTHFIDASTNPPQVAVNVNKVKSNEAVQDVAESAQSYMAQQDGVSDFNVLDEQEITASGMEGIVQDIQYTISGTQVNIKSVYLSSGSDVITLNIAGSAQTIENMAARFEYMLDHIELL